MLFFLLNFSPKFSRGYFAKNKTCNFNLIQMIAFFRLLNYVICSDKCYTML